MSADAPDPAASSSLDKAFDGIMRANRQGTRRSRHIALGTLLIAGVSIIAGGFFVSYLGREVTTAEERLKDVKRDVISAEKQRDQAIADFNKTTKELQKQTELASTATDNVDSLQRQITKLEGAKKTATDDLEKVTASAKSTSETLAATTKTLARVQQSTAAVSGLAVNFTSRTAEMLSSWDRQGTAPTKDQVADFLATAQRYVKQTDSVGELVRLAQLQELSATDEKRFQELLSSLAPVQASAPPPEKAADPLASPSAKKTVQFLLGPSGPASTTKLKTLESQFEHEPGYQIESGRANVTHLPASLEVRYYHHPQDREAAEALLKRLRRDLAVGSGRVSYVVDSTQPPRTFQVAFPPLAPPTATPEHQGGDLGIQVGFGMNFYSDDLRHVRARLTAIKGTRVGKDFPTMMVKNGKDYTLVIGPFPTVEQRDRTLARLRNDPQLVAALKQPSSGVAMISARTRPITISDAFGDVKREGELYIAQ